MKAALLILPLLLAARSARAQSTRCDGQRISSIAIDPHRPPFTGMAGRWREAAHSLGLHHATTRPAVIRSYLLLSEGQPCDEARRAETERVLRALPFLADAEVRAVDDGNGGVRIEVVTVDEVPVHVTTRMHGFAPAAFGVGNDNVGGNGFELSGGIERGFEYRNGFSVSAAKLGVMGRAIELGLDAERRPVGGSFGVDAALPFLSDLQRGSWIGAYSYDNDYVEIRRLADDGLTLPVRQQRGQLATSIRTSFGRIVTLMGGAMLWDRVAPAAQGVVLSDSGPVADTGFALLNRYTAFHALRFGGLAGLRRISYQTVTGFDALAAPQDVMSGVQLGVLAAPSLGGLGDRDLFIAGNLYAGWATPRSLIAGTVETEDRRGSADGRWDSMIQSSRVAVYLGGAPGGTLIVSNELSLGRRARIPLQLTFGDRDGGVRGYASSMLAGAARNVLRAEVRWARPDAFRHADLGIAPFTDVGTLWAGDAPYGTSATRASIGFSLMAAYPTRSKRLYRVDFAFPLSPDGGHRFEVRFTAADRTDRFWSEPEDVTRARLGPVPSTLFGWPTR